MDTEVFDENENPDCSQIKSACTDEKKVKKEVVCTEKLDSPESPEMKDQIGEPCESPSVAKVKSSKNRKKPDCSVQHVLRALNSLTTPEEKLAALCQKYADVFDENRKLQANLKQYEKQLTVVMKERDQVRSDLAKSVLSRSRLENLCRELQRQNKEIKEESFQKIREEEEKRKEVSAKFQTTLNEITELMKEDNDKTMKLRDDNIDMTSKLKSIYEQYEMREQQIEKMAKQMTLESQLYEARLAKMEMEASAEKEILLREKQQLLVTLTEYQAKFQEYQNIEMALRNQVALYNQKYEEFEKSLTRSNKMFGGFKEEMGSMSNKIINLESETVAWKERWETTQKALIEMAAEKQKSDKEIVIAAKQMSTLHKLCRTLQTERAQLLAKLKICDSTFTEKFNENLGNSLTDTEIDLSVKVSPSNIAPNSKSEEFKTEKKNSSKRISKSKVQPESNNHESTTNPDHEIELPEPIVLDLTSSNELTAESSGLRISVSDVESNGDCGASSDELSKSTTELTECARNASFKTKNNRNHDTSRVGELNNISSDNLARDSPALDSTVQIPANDSSKLEINSVVVNSSNSLTNDEYQEAAEVLTNTPNNSESSVGKISDSENYVLKEPSHSSKSKISPKKKSKK